MLTFPNPVQMHRTSMRIVDTSVDTSNVSFRDHVLKTIEVFSGLNSVPRIICDVLTREYMIFVVRKGHPSDLEELLNVAQELKLAGFYVEVEDTPVARASNTASLCFCWDPVVMRNAYAKRTLETPENFQLYLTVMQYIRAEKSLCEFESYDKDTLIIGGRSTRDWVSISLVSQQMYNEALCVCKILWSFSYYVGIVDNPRRSEAWTLFVSWDKNVLENCTPPDEFFTFTGALPATWQ